MGKNDGIVSSVLPFITRKETKSALNDSVLESKEVTVQGGTLAECNEIFQTEWIRK